MAKKPTRRKKNNEAFSTGNEPESHAKGAVPVVDDRRRWFLIGVFVVIALGGTYLAQAMKGVSNVQRFTYKKDFKKYRHDKGAFTQGLVWDDDEKYVWESTGKYDGQSSIRKVELETGKVVEKKTLPDDEFGEGLTLVGDKLYQLTWKEGVCHVYDKNLDKVKDFEYPGQGWGLTYDGKHLVMSDGTSKLYFRDPETFEVERVVTVRMGRAYINQLNELEYAGGFIYANRLDWDSVYKIDPSNGNVVAIIELNGLWKNRPAEGVMNGIAVKSLSRKAGRVIVTGKYCPFIYEIEIVPKSN